MLSGKSNAVERGKTAIGLISKKATLHVQHTFFCTFLCRCFARLQRETSRNFLVTRFMEEMSYVFSFTFFSLPLIFTLHWWPLAFLILSPLLQNFFVVLSTKKKCLLCFFFSALDLCRPFFLVELRLPAPYFPFSLYFSVGHRNNFRFPFSSLLTL